jgi:hypothetical protein
MRVSTTSWTNLLGSLGFKTKRKKRRGKQRPYRSRFAFRPQIAALEERQLMASFTIVDDDDGEGAQHLGFLVSRDWADGPATVDYTTVDVTTTAGSDYIAVSGRLTFEPGITQMVFWCR